MPDSTEQTLAKHEQIANRFANLIGLRFDHVEDGKCKCSLEVTNDHFHPGGVVHGGIAFSLADSSMAMALISTLEPGYGASTVELKMSYLEAVREGVMESEARIIRRGKRIAFMEAQVTRDGQLVATATATFAILKMR
ncbi:MAG: PaaI family thioesterase [Candidatus Hydrogenedentes bacterium]|nr:PaaI family thioesterase [Candidatus Hydrogenedentota bacterium]